MPATVPEERETTDAFATASAGTVAVEVMSGP